MNTHSWTASIAKTNFLNCLFENQPLSSPVIYCKIQLSLRKISVLFRRWKCLFGSYHGCNHTCETDVSSHSRLVVLLKWPLSVFQFEKLIWGIWYKELWSLFEGVISPGFRICVKRWWAWLLEPVWGKTIASGWSTAPISAAPIMGPGLSMKSSRVWWASGFYRGKTSL